MAKVKLSWDRSTDDGLLVEAQKILVDLTGNPSFPELETELPSLKSSISDFSGRLTNSLGGSVLDTAYKKDRRKDLERVMQSLGLKVQDISKGDGIKILSAGYRIKSERRKAGELLAPINVRVRAGIGTLVFFWGEVANARSYIIEFTECPITEDSKWKILTSTKRKITIENVTSGKQYGARIVGVGSNPKKNWSNVVTSFVL